MIILIFQVKYLKNLCELVTKGHSPCKAFCTQSVYFRFQRTRSFLPADFFHPQWLNFFNLVQFQFLTFKMLDYYISFILSEMVLSRIIQFDYPSYSKFFLNLTLVLVKAGNLNTKLIFWIQYCFPQIFNLSLKLLHFDDLFFKNRT